MASRSELMLKLFQVSFTVNDLTLYLDTHPTDEQALTLFAEMSKTRKHLMEEYEVQYEPLTIDCVDVDAGSNCKEYCNYPERMHFHWVDGPLPWEGGLI